MSQTVERTRRIEGSPTVWRALGHPLRKQIREHLAGHGSATSTTVAEALDVNTGTASYHLRVLAEAGLIEDDPDRPRRGRERWWRAVSVDLREPRYDSLSDDAKMIVDQRRYEQAPGEVALMHRFMTEAREHGDWAGISRASGWFTRAGLATVMDRFVQLLAEHSTDGDSAPGDAREMVIRMFFLPRDETDP